MVMVVWLARPSHLITERLGLPFKWDSLVDQTSISDGPSDGPACVDEVCHMTSCYMCVYQCLTCRSCRT